MTGLARNCLRVLLFSALGIFALAHTASAEIRYEISLSHPERHLFHVTMTIPQVRGEVAVQMPAWNALYQVRDFSSHVQEVSAFVAGAKVRVEKVDKQTWIIHAQGQVTLRYAAYWDDPGPFGTQLDSEHAFINPAMILMYVPDQRSEPNTLFFTDVPPGWRIQSSGHVLTLATEPTKSAWLESPNYDSLADSPIEIGQFKEFGFSLADVAPQITVVVHGEDWHTRLVEEELRKICEYEVRLMGDAPFPHYTFLFHTGKSADGAGGGMEHANGAAISVASEDQLPGVAAHEFFHLWNVKRIRPASLEPVDYTKEQYTRALWFAEGVTSTYGAYTLVRTGIWSTQDFYADLGQQIDILESCPANAWQSAEQSSLDAWLEKYPWYNEPDVSVSYYTKGQVLGALLDILIRERTDNRKSLDDVLRWLNEEFAKKGKFYRDSLDVRLAAEKIAGGSFQDFFQRYVAAAEPLPYREILNQAGLQLKQVSATRARLGFQAERGTGGAMLVRSVDPDGPAWQAGLRPGDLVVRWNNGTPPRYATFWATRRKPGDILRLDILRRGQQKELQFALGAEQVMHWTVTEDPAADKKAVRIRDGLLKGQTQKESVAAAER